MTRFAGLVASSLFVAAIFGFASDAGATNILVNPGFETGALGPWFQDRVVTLGGEDWNVTSADAHSGAFSATDIGNKEIRQNFPGVPGSLITDISFWTKHENSVIGAKLFVDLFYTDHSETQIPDLVTIGTEWEFFDVTSFLDTSKTLSGISFFGNSATRTFADDFVIAKVPEPSTLALFASSLVALGAAGRRRRTKR
jgi:hypothetical protein